LTGPERGFLLLTSRLGDPERKVLTTAQLRTLGRRMQNVPRPHEDRDLEPGDLLALGYDEPTARRIVMLLSEEDRLDWYITRSKRADCLPITRISAEYPRKLEEKLGLDAPGCLWARGDLSILSMPMVSLVGSREIRENNRRFAEEAGRQAAIHGFALVSGNARGADRIAQESCLASGGKVISVVADELWKQPLRENVLYLSEDDFEEGFSAQRALSRNRVIHALGIVTFVAQSSLHAGGTWDGTVKNLQNRWSEVYGFDDGSDAMAELSQMGLERIGINDLSDFYDLPKSQQNIFEY
jgi:predicted Rossmann fold nucleotide-binding protein DprA/Smf involved in DNA uptake